MAAIAGKDMGAQDRPMEKFYDNIIHDVAFRYENRTAYFSNLFDASGFHHPFYKDKSKLFYHRTLEHLLDIMLAYSSPVLEALCKEGLGYGKASAFSWHMDVLKHDLMLLSRLFWAFDAGVSRWIAEALVDTSLPQDGILHALHRWQAGEEPVTSDISHKGENILRHGAQGTEASSAKAVLENGALALKGQFYSTCDWAELAPLLIDYHGKYGIGHFAKHAAFTWSSAPGGGYVDNGARR